MAKKSNYKPDALIKAAKKLIYKRGFNITTLAEIASEANIPLGNVYYYFKAKVDIGISVLNSMALEQKIFLEGLNKEHSPQSRLHYFLEQAKQESELIAVHGCRIGTLCQELAKERSV